MRVHQGNQFFPRLAGAAPPGQGRCRAGPRRAAQRGRRRGAGEQLPGLLSGVCGARAAHRPGVLGVGYSDLVWPNTRNALLAGHVIMLRGLRSAMVGDLAACLLPRALLHDCCEQPLSAKEADEEGAESPPSEGLLKMADEDVVANAQEWAQLEASTQSPL